MGRHKSSQFDLPNFLPLVILSNTNRNASVSSLVAAGIERVMRDEAERETALEAMKDTIKRRMETTRNEWVEVDENDSMFANARKHLKNRQQ